MKRTRFAVLLLLITNSMFHKTAMADWADPGAAYLCDHENKVFSIKSFMDTSSPDDPGTIPIPPGYQVIKDGDYLNCIIVDGLNRHSVRANFSVSPPQSTGLCGGVTHTDINFLQVNDRPLFLSRQSFNSRCLNSPELYEIEIKSVNNDVMVKLCYADDWFWGKGYTGIYCTEESFQNHIENPREWSKK